MVHFTNKKVTTKTKIFSSLTPKQKKTFFTKVQLLKVYKAAKRELLRE